MNHQRAEKLHCCTHCERPFISDISIYDRHTYSESRPGSPAVYEFRAFFSPGVTRHVRSPKQTPRSPRPHARRSHPWRRWRRIPPNARTGHARPSRGPITDKSPQRRAPRPSGARTSKYEPEITRRARQTNELEKRAPLFPETPPFRVWNNLHADFTRARSDSLATGPEQGPVEAVRNATAEYSAGRVDSFKCQVAERPEWPSTCRIIYAPRSSKIGISFIQSRPGLCPLSRSPSENVYNAERRAEGNSPGALKISLPAWTTFKVQSSEQSRPGPFFSRGGRVFSLLGSLRTLVARLVIVFHSRGPLAAWRVEKASSNKLVSLRHFPEAGAAFEPEPAINDYCGLRFPAVTNAH